MEPARKIFEETEQDNVVPFRSKGKKKGKDEAKEVKLTKDGRVKRTPNNSKHGKSKKVQPFRKIEDIEAMKQYFRNRSLNDETPQQRQIAGKNLLMFIMGINLGLRASDLLKTTWDDVFDSKGNFKDAITKQEDKTEKYKTYTLNATIKKAINEYIANFNPLIEPDLHLFRSREGGTINVDSVNRIIKEAAKACGITYNVGSHSMRKTFGYQFLMKHQNDVMAITWLQNLLNHSSQASTLAYCGLSDDQNKGFYESLEL